MYIKRHIESTISKSLSAFPSVLLTGPRQVGKSTLLKTDFQSIQYVTLDDPLVLMSVKQDAMGFFKLYSSPLVIDEIQRIPECFTVLKYLIDSDRHAGMYLLTGSQKYELMQNVSESLAGRVCIMDMLGLSNREIDGDEFNSPFIPTTEYLTNRHSKTKLSPGNLWERIHRGSLPELYSNDNMDWEQYYASYVSTYIERDVRQLISVGDLLAFVQFMTALASRTGELLNMSSLAKDVGVDSKTIKKWISVLQASNVIYLLQPYSLNVTKRIIKTPKVYFTDTGLICYLCKWLTPETLMNGAMAGNIYETYIVSEILKSYYNAGKEPNLYFFRNTDGKEIDLLIHQNQTLYPIEIKKTSSPNIKDVKNFKILSDYFPTLTIGEGGVICNAENLLPLAQGIKIIPYNLI